MRRIKIFIDGGHGTTGLNIAERLSGNRRYRLLLLPDEKRKSRKHKREKMAECDIAVLCLPDDAARESVALIDSLPASNRPKVLDASSAHRTAQGWVYGFCELPDHVDEIANAKYVSNPGCYALAFVAIVRPLLEAQVINASFSLVAFGASGYSGGGRALIKRVEEGFEPLHSLYAMGLQHKHLPEMRRYTGLGIDPIFQPAVVNTLQGMVVSVALPTAVFLNEEDIDRHNTKNAYAAKQTLESQTRQTNNTLEWGKHNARETVYSTLHDYYHRCYQQEWFANRKQRITVEMLSEKSLQQGYFPFKRMAKTDDLAITVAGGHDQCIVHASLCNLGIGAAGNAIENIELMSQSFLQ